MLVLDPVRRYSVEQIKRHRWMLTEVPESVAMINMTLKPGGTASVEPNEQILKIMNNLGIDIQRTRESLKVLKTKTIHIYFIYTIIFIF